jgi:hypothetical protein
VFNLQIFCTSQPELFHTGVIHLPLPLQSIHDKLLLGWSRTDFLYVRLHFYKMLQTITWLHNTSYHQTGASGMVFSHSIFNTGAIALWRDHWKFGVRNINTPLTISANHCALQ